MKLRTGHSKITVLASLLTGLVCACLAAPVAADVKARLERNTVYEGDPVTLIIESDGQQSGQPDLTALQHDFTVLGNSTSTQVRIINGRRSDKTTWTVQLEPRHKNTLLIPPISVGDEQTQPLELKVTDVPEHIADKQSEHVFLEVEADTGSRSLYVQQQLPYTVRLYYDDKLLNGDLEAPQPDQAVVEQLGEDKQYTATRNGRHYTVIERHYAISPEKSGQLRIPPAIFKGQMASARKAPGQRSRHSRLIDQFFSNSPFANDPFFSNSPFADPGQPVRVHSDAISIDVQPRPASAGNTWLPAEQLTLQDSWTSNPPKFRAGEPVTRTITLQAKGLTGAQIPALQLEQPGPTRLYPEAPVNESRTDGDQVYGISKQSFTYISGEAGKLVIPAIELSWWNTRSNQQASARLPKWEVNVEPGSAGAQSRPAAKADNSTQATAAETPAPDVRTQGASWFEQLKAFRHWPVIAALLLLVILLSLALIYSRHKNTGTPTKKQGPPAAQNTRAKIKILLPQLERACATNDAKAAVNALLKLGHTQWPDDPPRNLGALAARLGHAHEQIMALERALYATGTGQWNGSGLWNSVKDDWNNRPRVEKNTTDDSLDPLYPQRI